MARLLAGLAWAALAFGPLVVFFAVQALWGLKPAIAASLVVMLADAAWRQARGLGFSRIYLLTSALTLVFGVVDLWATTPFMLKYEGSVTNLAIGATFAAGARGRRPLLLEFAEQTRDEPFPDRPDVIRFFQLFTLLWAAYFVLKAAAYLALARALPLGQAMAVRSVAGLASMALMMLFSVTQGPRLFALCQRLRLLPAAPPEG